MKIITVPNQNLRTTAKPVTQVDKKLLAFLKDFENTLRTKENPKGVGLAAPQVAKNWRILATNVSQNFQLYINPIIIKRAKKLSLGIKDNDPDLEGCLSITGFYGAVPRAIWVEVAYQELLNGKLVDRQKRLEWFEARVLQHEVDHLDGILFTDYVINYDLPLYLEDKKTKKLIEVTNKELVKTF